MRAFSAAFLFVLLTPAVYAGQPVREQHAMVVSVQRDATDAGVAILKQGGNAVDAAVATGFALAVTYPYAGNLGGGGFMLVRMKDGSAHFLDYREKAPLAATRNMYLDAQGNVVPGLSLVGYKASGVPGSVAGLVKAEKLWGSLGLRKVMAPAIRLAREGYTLNEDEAQMLHTSNLGKFPESKGIFQRNGDFYKAGQVFRQPELARTLERIFETSERFLSWPDCEDAGCRHAAGRRPDHNPRPRAIPGYCPRAAQGDLSRIRNPHRASTLLRRHSHD